MQTKQNVLTKYSADQQNFDQQNKISADQQNFDQQNCRPYKKIDQRKYQPKKNIWTNKNVDQQRSKDQQNIRP